MGFSTTDGARVTTNRQSPDELVSLAELMSAEQDFSNARPPADPLVRRRRRRRAWITAAVVVLVSMLAAGGYAAWALNATLPEPIGNWNAPNVPDVAPAVIVDHPADGASAVSVTGADEYLGESASGIWSTSGSDEPRSMASISKLITALVILDAVPLADAEDKGPTITFDRADHALYDKYYVLGATIAPMPTGTTMSQRQALATMLIPSASNYADALSRWAFGSQGAYLSAARDWLVAHDLTQTTIVDPTGISPRNTSTPRDLLALAKLAAAHPTIAEIVALPSITVPGAGHLVSTNNLLGVNGVDGLKTGNLGTGTFSLLYTASLGSATGEQLTVTGVVLDGYSRDSVNDTVTGVLDSIRAGFHREPLVSQGQVLGSYSTPWGATVQIVVGQSASLLTWSDTGITLTADIADPQSFADGAIVDTLTWTAGPNTATATVEIEGSIEPPSAWWRLTHPGELGAD